MADDSDLTRTRAVVDQQLAGLEDANRDLVAKYVALRDSGMDRTDAICRLGAEVHDKGKLDTVSMALAIAAARLADYRGDLPDLPR